MACPASPVGALVGYLVACSAVAGVVFCIQQSGASVIPFAVTIESLQLLSMVGLVDVSWPEWFTSGLFPAASVVTGNLEVGALGCVSMPGGDWGRWVLELLLPITAASGLVVLHLCAMGVSALRRWFAWRGQVVDLDTTMAPLQRYPLSVDSVPLPASGLNAALGVMCVTYLYALRVSLDPLRCVEVNGSLVLDSDRSSPCSLSRFGQRGAVSVAVAGAYGVLVPVLVWSLLWRYASGVRTDLRLYAGGRVASTPTLNPYHFLRYHLSSVYNHCSPGCYLWQVVVLWRKLLVVITVSLLHHRPEVCVRALVGVLLVSVAVQCSLQPYSGVALFKVRSRLFGAW